MDATTSEVALRFAVVTFSIGASALWACSWVGWRAVKRRGAGLLGAGFSGFGIALLLLFALSVTAQVMLSTETKEGFSSIPGVGMFVFGLFLSPAGFVLGLLGGAAAGGRRWRSQFQPEPTSALLETADPSEAVVVGSRLRAAGIPFVVERSRRGSAVMVPASQLAVAREVLLPGPS